MLQINNEVKHEECLVRIVRDFCKWHNISLIYLVLRTILAALFRPLTCIDGKAISVLFLSVQSLDQDLIRGHMT